MGLSKVYGRTSREVSSSLSGFSTYISIDQRCTNLDDIRRCFVNHSAELDVILMENEHLAEPRRQIRHTFERLRLTRWRERTSMLSERHRPSTNTESSSCWTSLDEQSRKSIRRWTIKPIKWTNLNWTTVNRRKTRADRTDERELNVIGKNSLVGCDRRGDKYSTDQKIHRVNCWGPAKLVGTPVRIRWLMRGDLDWDLQWSCFAVIFPFHRRQIYLEVKRWWNAECFWTDRYPVVEVWSE